MTNDSRRSRKWMWAALAVLAALVAWGVSSGLSWLLSDPKVRLEKEIARLRAAGYATTPEEWAADPIAPEENAAPEIDAADAWLLATAGPEQTWTAPGPWQEDAAPDLLARLDASQAAELDEFLTRLGPYFDLVESALERPHAWWPLALDANGMVTSRELPQLRRFVRLHHARTWCRTGVRQPAGPMRVRLRLGRVIERPSLFTGMVVMACAESAARDVRDVLAGGKAAAPALRAELDEPLRMTFSDRMSSLVRAEIVNSAGMLTQFVSVGLIDDGTRIRRIDSTGYRIVTRLWFGGPPDVLRALSEAAEVAEPSYPVRRRRYEAIDGDAPSIAHSATLIFPIIARKAARADAVLRLARVALAATERRETTGAWPASLDDLSDMFPDGGVPLDPFTDRPFVYEVRGRGVRIASAGRCDDEPAVSAAELAEDGLVWTIER